MSKTQTCKCDTPHVTCHGRPACIRHKSAARGGAACKQPPMKGQTVCEFHGGAAPQNKAAAKVRLAEAEATKAMLTYGRPIETTATEALLDEVKWTAGHVAWLRGQIQALEEQALPARAPYDKDGVEADGDVEYGEYSNRPPVVEQRHSLVWGQTKEKLGGDDRGSTFEAKPNLFLTLYQAERTHLVKVCATAISAGIEERKVRLAESQGALVAEAIRGILGELGLTAKQQQLIADVVPRHLRLLTG